MADDARTSECSDIDVDGGEVGCFFGNRHLVKQRTIDKQCVQNLFGFKN